MTTPRTPATTHRGERRERLRPTLLALAVATLIVSGCGGDDGASGGASGVTENSADGSVVEVPPVEPLGPDDQYVTGTDVEVGEVADMGAIRVTVTDIAPGPAGVDPDLPGSIVATMTVESDTDAETFLPDTYLVCAADGRTGLPTLDSELEFLAPLGAGDSIEGTVTVAAFGDCDSVLLQVRSLNEATPTEPIAQWAVPPDALPF